MAGENQSGMQCVEVEALLAEALDGTLQGSQLAALRGPSAELRLLPEHGGRGPGRNALAEGAG